MFANTFPPQGVGLKSVVSTSTDAGDSEVSTRTGACVRRPMRLPIIVVSDGKSLSCRDTCSCCGTVRTRHTPCQRGSDRNIGVLCGGKRFPRHSVTKAVGPLNLRSLHQPSTPAMKFCIVAVMFVAIGVSHCSVALSPPNKEKAHALMLEGVNAHTNGRAQDAMRLYELAIEADYLQYNAHHFKAALLYEAGQSVAAGVAVDIALRLAPSEPGIWNTAGEIRRKNG